MGVGLGSVCVCVCVRARVFACIRVIVQYIHCTCTFYMSVQFGRQP